VLKEAVAGSCETHYLYSELHVTSHEAITCSYHHENLKFHFATVDFGACTGMQHQGKGEGSTLLLSVCYTVGSTVQMELQ